MRIDIGEVGVAAAIERVERALGEIAAGQQVVVVDGGQNEGHLVFAAECATPDLVAFMVRHTSGYVGVSLPGSECDRLGLPPMQGTSSDRRNAAFRVSVDLAAAQGTGISALDRARTIAAIAGEASVPSHFTRPGHVVPMLAASGGVLAARGAAEAAVDLTRLAGLRPVAALSTIVSLDRPTDMAEAPELQRWSAEHGLALISIADLVAYRRRKEPQVIRGVRTLLPTMHSGFHAIGYRDVIDGAEHIALLAGDVDDDAQFPVHVHTECLTGDALGSLFCDCRRRLERAMSMITALGRGVVVYIRPHGPARGCGLFEVRPVPTDRRPIEVAAHILRDLGIRSVHLIDAVPEDRAVVQSYGMGLAEHTLAGPHVAAS